MFDVFIFCRLMFGYILWNIDVHLCPSLRCVHVCQLPLHVCASHTQYLCVLQCMCISVIRPCLFCCIFTCGVVIKCITHTVQRCIVVLHRGARENMYFGKGDFITQLHSWWHLFAGLGAYIHILSSSRLRMEVLGYKTVIKVCVCVCVCECVCVFVYVCVCTYLYM